MSVMNLGLSTPRCGVPVPERITGENNGAEAGSGRQVTQKMVAGKVSNRLDVGDQENGSCPNRFINLRA